MAKKNEKVKVPRREGTTTSNRLKINKKNVSKNSGKMNKKQNQLQIKQLDKLDLEITDINSGVKTKLNPVSSLESQKMKLHYKEDKKIVEEHDKVKKATEKNIEDQLELISGFSL
ncbi:hypothetical protein C6P41_004139 [Kluyveromyces marxianus]|nr:hypothetical protein C6P43_004703 [Kluyveromyces marxianus]KAG0681764.1 hypothetical protein C6P41_004139 [Kluyveromyces marxianus]